MHTLLQDLRYARRSLVRSPIYSLVTIVTLALGIGATAALFTVVDGVLLQPLPFPDSHRLVQIVRVDPTTGAAADVAWPDFSDWRDQSVGFQGMAASTESSRTVLWDDVAESLNGARVSRDYFEVMGVLPLLGRTFTEEEDRLQGPDAIVLSHALWQRRLGGDPGVLGTTLLIDGVGVPIVGVMPAGFRAPVDGEFWEPLQDDELLAGLGLPTGTRSLSFLSVVARLGEADQETAGASLAALAARIDEEVGRESAKGVRLTSLQETLVGNVRATLWFLMSAVALVMIVACANVAGLSLSRAAGRERELALRSALGAGRSRLVGLLFVESLAIATSAGLLGIGLAWGLTAALLRVAPPSLPRLDEVAISSTTILFGIVLTLAAAFLFGMVPALRASRAGITEAMSSGERGSSASSMALRPQRLMVVVQVALSVVLLSAAALLANSFTRLLRVERGFDDQGILVATVLPSEDRYTTPEEVEAFYDELLSRVRAIPGVVAATSTYSPPLEGNEFRTLVRREDEPPSAEGGSGRWAGTVIVRDDFFRTTGTPLLQGRLFGPQDRLDTPPVAIVSQTMAERFWPGENPIGKSFVFDGGLSGSADSFLPAFFRNEPFTVVGVAGDVRRVSLAEDPEPEYYRPHSQITWGNQYLLVRSGVPASSLIEPLREAVRAQDRTVPLPEIRTQSSRVSESLATPRFRTLLLGGFAAITCLLAMVGLYAVMAMAVARRTREMGIRLALGASPSGLRKGVLAGGLRLVGIGVAIGLATAVLSTRLIAAMLFEVAPSDPLTYALVTIVTVGVALLACYAPALRASRVDPMVSLRGD